MNERTAFYKKSSYSSNTNDYEIHRTTEGPAHESIADDEIAVACPTSAGIGFRYNETYKSFTPPSSGDTFGGSVSYFQTDDVELKLAYDEATALSNGNSKTSTGSSAPNELYAFNNPSDLVRPYVSAGFLEQSISATVKNEKDPKKSSDS